MNKKGASYTIWIEVIIMLSVITGIALLIQGDLNGKYHKNEDLTFGLSNNASLDALIGQQDTFDTAVRTGEASQTASSDTGLSWSDSWKIITGTTKIIWDFITGGFLNNLIIGMLHLPIIVYIALRVLWFLSIGFIILKILFKVVP